MDCNHSFFFSNDYSQTEKCYVAQHYCQDEYDLINFYQLTYCYFSSCWYLYIPFCLIMAAIIFKFITQVVEDYLGQSIEFIYKYFKMPESIGAITLLALVNGAGDLLTAFVSSGQNGGLFYNIGSIYGSGLCESTIIIGLVILTNKDEIKIGKQILLRDLGIYIASTLVVVIFGFLGFLSYVTSIIFFLIYIFLVIVIVYQELSSSKCLHYLTIQSQVHDQGNKESKNQIEFSIMVKENDELEKNKEKEEEKKKEVQKEKQKEKQEEQGQILEIESKQSILQKLIGGVLFLTLPHSPSQEFSRKRLGIFLLGASVMCFYVHTGSFNLKNYFLFVFWIVALMSIVLYKFALEFKKKNRFLLLQMVTVYIVLCWIYLMTEILVDSLQTLGMISNFDKSYLGLTIISLGSTYSDAVMTITLSNQGQPVLGIIGVYTGQLFSLLLGFGVALLRMSIRVGNIEYEPYQGDSQYLIGNMVLFSTLGVLILTFGNVIMNNGRFSRWFGKMLIGIYIIFLLITTSIELLK